MTRSNINITYKSSTCPSLLRTFVQHRKFCLFQLNTITSVAIAKLKIADIDMSFVRNNTNNIQTVISTRTPKRNAIFIHLLPYSSLTKENSENTVNQKILLLTEKYFYLFTVCLLRGARSNLVIYFAVPKNVIWTLTIKRNLGWQAMS